MRRIHLFTTDESSLRLLAYLPRRFQVASLIIPENRLHSTKVAKLEAAAHNIPIYVHRRRERLCPNLPPADAAISWLYSQIIASEDLTAYRTGILNMHGGRIPEYRGANVLQWAIINGETTLGVTWHKLVEAVDAGAIMTEASVPIDPLDTAITLREKMIDAAIRVFPSAWQRFLDPTFVGRIPDLTGGRIWPSRTPSDGQIGERWTEQRVRNLVRALCPPWPPATIEHGGRRHGVAAVLSGPEHAAVPYLTFEGYTVYLRLLDA